MTGKDEMTISGAARLTGYSHTHLKHLARTGRVKARKASQRRWMFEVQSILTHAALAQSMGTSKYLGMPGRKEPGHEREE